MWVALEQVLNGILIFSNVYMNPVVVVSRSLREHHHWRHLRALEDRLGETRHGSAERERSCQAPCAVSVSLFSTLVVFVEGDAALSLRHIKLVSVFLNILYCGMQMLLTDSGAGLYLATSSLSSATLRYVVLG